MTHFEFIRSASVLVIMALLVGVESPSIAVVVGGLMALALVVAEVWLVAKTESPSRQ